MAVNRVRYQESLRGRRGAAPFRGVSIVAASLRSKQSRHRRALGYLLRRSRWQALPRASKHGGDRRD